MCQVFCTTEKKPMPSNVPYTDCAMFLELEKGTITCGENKKIGVNNSRWQCALVIRGINNWNSLIDNIVLSDNIIQFITRFGEILYREGDQI